MMFFGRSDWLLNLRIAFTIHLHLDEQFLMSVQQYNLRLAAVRVDL